MREAHSANLKSWHHHIFSAPIVAYSMGCPRVFTHPCTNPSRPSLTLVVWQETLCLRHVAVDSLKQKSL